MSVAKKLVCQRALKPSSRISRSAGRNSPTKLGCGQPDFSSTWLSRPTGVMLSDSVPCSLRSKPKSRFCTSPACRFGSGTCTPPGRTGSPLPGWKSKLRPLSSSFSALLMPRMSLMPTARKGASKR